MARFHAFKTRATGKWILTGEHAVLRGVTAIALPLPSRTLTLRFTPDETGRFHAPASVLDLIAALKDGWENRDRTFPPLSGTLDLESDIPIGAGLGSSAALCVALARWLDEPLGLTADRLQTLPEFARELENHFHGRSSGLDVNVVHAGEPLAFVSGRPPTALGVKQLPEFTFHDTGLRSSTRDCILRVEDLRESDPGRAMQIDEQMAQATRHATEGLIRFQSGDRAAGTERTAQAMNLAHQCFESWGLVPDPIRTIRDEILSRGALAAKLTGSGNGGFLVALWPNE